MKCVGSSIGDDKVASVFSVDHCTLKPDGASASVCHLRLTPVKQKRLSILRFVIEGGGLITCSRRGLHLQGRTTSSDSL